MAVRQQRGGSWPRAHRLGGTRSVHHVRLGPGQGVVAERIQEVDCSADQLAGLRQGRAFAVDAVLDLGVVVVIRGDVRAWVLPAS